MDVDLRTWNLLRWIWNFGKLLETVGFEPRTFRFGIGDVTTRLTRLPTVLDKITYYKLLACFSPGIHVDGNERSKPCQFLIKFLMHQDRSNQFHKPSLHQKVFPMRDSSGANVTHLSFDALTHQPRAGVNVKLITRNTSLLPVGKRTSMGHNLNTANTY